MNLTLKKFKFYAALSEETNCFTADLVLDGVVVGDAENRGQGGCTNVHLNEVGRANPDLLAARDRKEFDDGSLESIVDDLVMKAITQDAIKKDTARLVKSLKKQVLFFRHSKDGLRNIKGKGVVQPDGTVHPSVVAQLKNDKDVKLVLNFLPVAEAEKVLAAKVTADYAR